MIENTKIQKVNHNNFLQKQFQQYRHYHYYIHFTLPQTIVFITSSKSGPDSLKVCQSHLGILVPAALNTDLITITL